MNQTWFKATAEGTYYGQCSELCGAYHGFMPIQVEVVSAAAFEAWTKEAQEQFARADVIVGHQNVNHETVPIRDFLLGDGAKKFATFYHSHPDHDAYFSATDLERSEEVQWGEPWVPPTYTYLVVSVRGGIAANSKAFRIVAGQALEESIDLLP